jgi:hypothetical protein
MVDERLRGDEGKHGRLRGFLGHDVHARSRLFLHEIAVVTVEISDSLPLLRKDCRAVPGARIGPLLMVWLLMLMVFHEYQESPEVIHFPHVAYSPIQ